MAERFVRDDFDMPLGDAFDVCVAGSEIVVSNGAGTTVMGAAAALESARRLVAAAGSLDGLAKN